jgi:hypothetical protein
MFGVGTLGAAVPFESAQGGTLFGVAFSLILAAVALVTFGALALRGSRRAWRLGLVASAALMARLCAADVRRAFGIQGDLKEALSSWS